MSQKRARSPSPSGPQVCKSSPIDDRSSRFIAAFSPELSYKELQDLPDFNGATHRIAAWRLPSSQQSLTSQLLHETGYDDDGERYGGKTLERVLTTVKVEGAIVVARWYGGIMLGPIRFDHMKNCATDAVLKWKDESEVASKRLKLEASDRDERARLIEELPKRDQSIVVLRGLLAEKKMTTTTTTTGAVAKRDPSVAIDYSKLPLSALRKLDQVRDATIGWILKQIETIEQSQGELDEVVEASEVEHEHIAPS